MGVVPIADVLYKFVVNLNRDTAFSVHTFYMYGIYTTNIQQILLFIVHSINSESRDLIQCSSIPSWKNPREARS